MTILDQFVDEVLSRIPHGPRRDRIEMDLRAHIAERLELGQSIEQAIHQFGDPAVLADSYLASTPLVSASFFSRVAAKLSVVRRRQKLELAITASETPR